MDDPIFDPWSSGEDENEPKASERGPRWRSASGSEGVPRSRPRPVGRPGEPRHGGSRGAPGAESPDVVDLGDLAPDSADAREARPRSEPTPSTPRSAEERQVVWFLDDDDDSLEAITDEFGEDLLDAPRGKKAPEEGQHARGRDRRADEHASLEAEDLAPDSHPAPDANDAHRAEPPPPPPPAQRGPSEPSWSPDPPADPMAADDPHWSPDPPADPTATEDPQWSPDPLPESPAPESLPSQPTRPAAGEEPAGPSIGGQPGREIGQDDRFGLAKGSHGMAEKAPRDPGPRDPQPPGTGTSESPADFWYRQIPPTRPEPPRDTSEEVASASGIGQQERRAELDAAVGMLRNVLLPTVAELNQRLRLARHETTVDDRLSREHPSFRFRMVPCPGPFDEVDEHTGSALEISLDGRFGDTVSGSVWLDPLAEAPTQQRAVATKDLTGAWVEELLIDFVAEALGRR